MIASTVAMRVLLFVPVVMCVMIVYAGLKESTAGDTLRAAVPKTVKTLVYTVVLVIGMLVLEWLFIS